MDIKPIQSNQIDDIVQLVKEAFKTNLRANNKEYLLVRKLLLDRSLPSWSTLCATIKEKIVGSVILTPLTFKGTVQLNIVALAPLVVDKAFQAQGIGTALIRVAIKNATKEKCDAIVLIGEPHYYKRFGFLELGLFGLSLPYEHTSKEHHQIYWIRDPIQKMEGKFIYPKHFQTYLKD